MKNKFLHNWKSFFVCQHCPNDKTKQAIEFVDLMWDRSLDCIRLTHRNVGWILNLEVPPKLSRTFVWHRHISPCCKWESWVVYRAWKYIAFRCSQSIYHESAAAMNLWRPENIKFEFKDHSKIVHYLHSSQICSTLLILTFEIVGGSSRKLNFDDKAFPVHIFQGIKMLNIIKWIRKPERFDPVFFEHHGLGKMSRISANH